MKNLTRLTILLLTTPFITAQSNAARVETVSYYGKGFHGKRAADGSIFNQNAMTCAATKKYNFGTLLKVTNVNNGKSVVCKVTDRGAFGHKYNRALDLSQGSFSRIANLSQGLAKVTIEPVTKK